MKDVLDQATKYHDYAQFARTAHYADADSQRRWHNRLGLPLTVISAVVSTTIFATLNSDPSAGWHIAAGIVAATATVLAAIQTFYKFGDLSERHRVAAARYGALRNDLENFILRYGKAGDRAQALDDLDELGDRLGQLDELSPGFESRKHKREAPREPGKRSEPHPPRALP